MAQKSGRLKEFARWPKYKAAYMRAFRKMLEERNRRGKLDGSWRIGTGAEDVYHWWMEDGVLPGQEMLDEFTEEIYD